MLNVMREGHAYLNNIAVGLGRLGVERDGFFDNHLLKITFTGSAWYVLF